MTDPKNGDRIIEKQEDGSYNVLDDAKTECRAWIATFDLAKQIAREGLATGGRILYRDCSDPPDHFELV